MLIAQQNTLFDKIKNDCLRVISANFQRVSTQIELIWGTPECENYLRSLMINDRTDSRQGFPFEVLDSIMSLANLHAEKYGSNLMIVFGKVEEIKSTDIWKSQFIQDK
jgi:hypothetical protein